MSNPKEGHDPDLCGPFAFKLVDSIHMKNGCHMRYYDADQRACLEVISTTRKTSRYYYLQDESQEFTDVDSFADHVEAVRRREPTTLEVSRLRKMLVDNGVNPDSGGKIEVFR